MDCLLALRDAPDASDGDGAPLVDEHDDDDDERQDRADIVRDEPKRAAYERPEPRLAPAHKVARGIIDEKLHLHERD